jgi:hypothetical protein
LCRRDSLFDGFRIVVFEAPGDTALYTIGMMPDMVVLAKRPQLTSTGAGLNVPNAVEESDTEASSVAAPTASSSAARDQKQRPIWPVIGLVEYKSLVAMVKELDVGTGEPPKCRDLYVQLHLRPACVP